MIGMFVPGGSAWKVTFPGHPIRRHSTLGYLGSMAFERQTLVALPGVHETECMANFPVISRRFEADAGEYLGSSWGVDLPTPH